MNIFVFFKNYSFRIITSLFISGGFLYFYRRLSLNRKLSSHPEEKKKISFEEKHKILQELKNLLLEIGCEDKNYLYSNAKGKYMNIEDLSVKIDADRSQEEKRKEIKEKIISHFKNVINMPLARGKAHIEKYGFSTIVATENLKQNINKGNLEKIYIFIDKSGSLSNAIIKNILM